MSGEKLAPCLCISYTGREPVFLRSFIPSASCRSNYFTILSPSPLRGVEKPQQVQATSDRSRISTKACSPITCVTGCATKSQLTKPCLYATQFKPEAISIASEFFSQLTRWRLRSFLAGYCLSLLLLSMLSEISTIFTTN